MNSTVRPSAFSPRRLSNSSSTSCGTSTAVGSSRMIDLRAAVEHLEDLDALAVADAEVVDQPVRVDVEAVGLGELVDPVARPVTDAVQLLGAEHDVLQHGEVVGQHEVLEDHPDPGVDRVRRRAERHLSAVDLDRAVVGLLDAVQDLHQRRLAGAVLPDERVDGAASDGQVDVVVRDDAREALADAGQPDRGLRRVDSATTCRPDGLVVVDGRSLPHQSRTRSGTRDERYRVRPGPTVASVSQTDGHSLGTVILPSMICCL